MSNGWNTSNTGHRHSTVINRALGLLADSFADEKGRDGDEKHVGDDRITQMP